MNLSYVNFSKCKDKKIIKKIYKESFAKEERFPFWLLKYCSKEENVIFNVIYDDNKPVGFQYIIKYDVIAYLMYFAIKNDKRNIGYGSEVLKQLNKSHDNVLLSIEKPTKEMDIKHRRKQYYLRNGFITTNKSLIDNNVEYELLCNNSKLNITNELLQKRYTKMTNSKIVRFIISKIFNVYNIELNIY